MSNSETNFEYMVSDEVLRGMAEYLNEEWNIEISWGQIKKAYKESQIENNKRLINVLF